MLAACFAYSDEIVHLVRRKAYRPFCRRIVENVFIKSTPRSFHGPVVRRCAFPAAGFRFVCDRNRAYPWGWVRFTLGSVGYSGALGNLACRNGYAARYCKLSRLLSELTLAKAEQKKLNNG